jgi:hypothetical protein
MEDEESREGLKQLRSPLAAVTSMKEDPNGAVVDGSVDGIHEAAQAYASGGEQLRVPVEATSSPGPIFGLCPPWYPTHAVLTDVETGSRYAWSSRAHRKLRYPESLAGRGGRHHPGRLCQRLRLLSFEPRAVTWRNCWVGIVANTLWVVNGLYATWPRRAAAADPALISYGTGVEGAFLFIVCSYLGFVEAINQTYAPMELPVTAGGRTAKRPSRHFLPARALRRAQEPDWVR